MARATTDILAAAAFGIEMQALTPESESDGTNLVDLLHYVVGEIMAGYGKIIKKPLRALLPWLPYCKKYERNHTALYAIWAKMTDQLLAQPSKQDNTDNNVPAGLGEALKQLLGTPSQGEGCAADSHDSIPGALMRFLDRHSLSL